MDGTLGAPVQGGSEDVFADATIPWRFGALPAAARRERESRRMVTEEELTAGRPRIVVGVDGSDPSESALRWAVNQAELVGGVVEAVTAWEYPLGWGWDTAVASLDLEANAGQILDDALNEALGSERSVEIRRHVIHNNPAAALLEVAEGAQLLVVGNRGHGGFTGALLGSVSQHVVHHAHCPVVIVRSDSPAKSGQDAAGSDTGSASDDS